jgi:hypothetical protein
MHIFLLPTVFSCVFEPNAPPDLQCAPHQSDSTNLRDNMAPKQRMRLANDAYSKNVSARGNVAKSLVVRFRCSIVEICATFSILSSLYLRTNALFAEN